MALGNAPLLTPTEERDLAVRYFDTGDQWAKDKLVTHNVRLVIGIARQFMGRGMELDDLIQEGIAGLIRAIEKFDPHRGLKLSTYSTWWIMHAIQRGVGSRGQAVRTPSVVTLRRRAAESLLDENPELASQQGHLARRVASAVGARGCTVPQLDAALSGGRVVASMDERSTLERERYAQIADPNSPDPYEELAAGVPRQAVAELKEPDRLVVRLRFGLEDEGPYNFREIGERLGVTSQRVKQIQDRALASLREVLSEP